MTNGATVPVCPKCKTTMSLMATTYEAYWINPNGPPVKVEDLKEFSKIYVCESCKTALSEKA